MAVIVDKETGHYWRYFGSGLTDNPEKAYHYTDAAAAVICRMYHGETLMMTPGKEGSWVTYEHIHDPKSMPAIGSKMKENNLIWVAHEGVWMVVDRQSVMLATLAMFDDGKKGTEA